MSPCNFIVFTVMTFQLVKEMLNLNLTGNMAKLASRKYVNGDILVMPTLSGRTIATKLPEPAPPIQKFVDQWDKVLMDPIQQ